MPPHVQSLASLDMHRLPDFSQAVLAGVYLLVARRLREAAPKAEPLLAFAIPRFAETLSYRGPG